MNNTLELDIILYFIDRHALLCVRRYTAAAHTRDTRREKGFGCAFLTYSLGICTATFGFYFLPYLGCKFLPILFQQRDNS